MNFLHNKFCIELKMLESGELPLFLGSAIRGLLGTALMDKYCNNSTLLCDKCENNCLYKTLFSTQVQTKNGKRDIPCPYVIYSPLRTQTICKAGDSVYIHLSIFGNETVYATNYIEALIAAEKYGLGVNRIKFKVDSVINIENKTYLYYMENFYENKITLTVPHVNLEIKGVTLTFDLPLKIRTYAHGDAHKVDFPLIIRNMARRANEVLEFRCNSSYKFDIEHCNETALLCKQVKNCFEWFDLKRYSNRTATKVDLSGLIGQIAVEGDINDLIPLIGIAEIINIGKSCTMGLGHFDASYICK